VVVGEAVLNQVWKWIICESKAEEGVVTPRPASHLQKGMGVADAYRHAGSQIWSLPIYTLMTNSILCTLPDSYGQSSSAAEEDVR
jgi:hypothetical protein